MNHFAAQQKLTHCKSTILWLKKYWKEKKKEWQHVDNYWNWVMGIWGFVLPFSLLLCIFEIATVFKKGHGQPQGPVPVMDLHLQVFLKSSTNFRSHPPWMRITPPSTYPHPSALSLIKLWSLLLFSKFCFFDSWKRPLCCFSFHFFNHE